MIRKNNVLLILLILFLSSCYTVKTMNRQVTKGYYTYPVEFKDLSVKLLPLKEKIVTTRDTQYIKGDVIIDTIYSKADCDTVKPNEQGKKIVYLPGKLRIDTVRINTIDSIISTDTRELDVIKAQSQDKDIIIAKKDTKINILTWSISILGGIMLLIIVLKWFKIL